MAFEGADDAGVLNVPELDGAVHAAGECVSAVLGIHDAGNALVVAAEAVGSPAGAHVPGAEILVVAAGDGGFAVGRDGQAADHLHGGFKAADDLAGVDVPEIDVAFAAADEDARAVGGDGEAIDDEGEAGEMLQRLAGGRVPEPHAAVGVFLEMLAGTESAAGGEDALAVGEESGAIHPGLMLGEDFLMTVSPVGFLTIRAGSASARLVS